jgi:hypothetical protein
LVPADGDVVTDAAGLHRRAAFSRGDEGRGPDALARVPLPPAGRRDVLDLVGDARAVVESLDDYLGRDAHAVVRHLQRVLADGHGDDRRDAARFGGVQPVVDDLLQDRGGPEFLPVPDLFFEFLGREELVRAVDGDVFAVKGRGSDRPVLVSRNLCCYTHAVYLLWPRSRADATDKNTSATGDTPVAFALRRPPVAASDCSTTSQTRRGRAERLRPSTPATSRTTPRVLAGPTDRAGTAGGGQASSPTRQPTRATSSSASPHAMRL